MKDAIVTGATKGIGRAVAEMLLNRGYAVTGNYASDVVSAAEALESMRKLGSVKLMRASQANRSEFGCFISAILEKGEAIDCIVCNTGITVRRPTFEIGDDEWDRVFEVAVNSHYHLIRDLRPLIADNARIVFIGSAMGIHPHATSLPYGVSKAAVHALARNLVKDFAGTGVTVNAIAPGFVETEWQKNKPEEIRRNINAKTAAGRFAASSEIVSAVGFCLDNAFVNGTIIEVDGGYDYR